MGMIFFSSNAWIGQKKDLHLPNSGFFAWAVPDIGCPFDEFLILRFYSTRLLVKFNEIQLEKSAVNKNRFFIVG